MTASFAVAMLVLVGMLASVAYFLTEHYVVRQRERALLHQSYVDARTLRDEYVRSRRLTTALTALDRSPDSNIVVAQDGRWYGTSVSVAETTLPERLRTDVARGSAVHQRIRRNGRPLLAVGFPLPSIGAQYYETFTLTELDRTLNVLRNALAGGALVAVALAGAVGYRVSRRALRPVSEFAAAAERVAAGDLRTRLAPEPDPDLASLAASFNEMVRALERRIEREERFVADVSHELRSPLTTLATTAEVLATRRAQLPERSQRALDLLEVEVTRLRHLVDDLLELSRADAGVAPLELEPVDLVELVRHTVQRETGSTALVEAAATGATDGSLHVAVDKRRLDRVLTNLVANAQTHGGGLRRVQVGAENGHARIAVEDAGPGVEQAERDAVFARFFRGSAAGRRASGHGSGLGLALVAEHVSLHGGRVWVEDASPAGGARFVVELPRREA